MLARTSSTLSVQACEQSTDGRRTGGRPDLDPLLLGLLVHPWLGVPLPDPGGPKTPLYR
jgi:hypothetical protein